MEVKAKEFSNYFVVQGRTYFEDGWLYLNHTASSFEGEFEGNNLSLKVKGRYHNKTHATYIRVIIDDTRRKIKASNGEQDLTFDVSVGHHHFKIVKLPESSCCSFAVASVACKGKFQKLKNDRVLNLEFIGDSITAGYGNMARGKEEPFCTRTQDGQRSFAYLVGEELHANYNVVAAGGHPIYKSPFAQQSLPSLYSNIDLYRNQEKWDFDTFRPDVIVVELGVNDMSYLKRVEESKKDVEKENLKKHFVDFVRRLLQQNCKIVLLYGFYGNEELEDITLWVKDEIGDKRVSTLQTNSIIDNGDICAGHPGWRTHKLTTQLLVEHIKNILKLGNK